MPQRLLLTGLVVAALAGILAGVLAYGQYKYNKNIEDYIQKQQKKVHELKPWQAILVYRNQLAPGIDTPSELQLSQQRQRLAVGMVIAIAAGAIGVVLVGIGVAGMVKKGSG